MANREDTLATFRRVRAIQAVDKLLSLLHFYFSESFSYPTIRI